MAMTDLIMARCIVCQLTFCCGDCRWRHEKIAHGLMYDCPICRGNRFLCRPEQLNEDFIRHLSEEHFPLQCRKCNRTFTKMEELINIDECTSISELVGKEAIAKNETNEVDNRFDSLYEKVANTEGENFEAIVSVNKSSRTAVITPIIRKKYLVDYESSDTEAESPKSLPHIPSKLNPKTPKLKKQRAATPHAKKYLTLMRQKVVEEYEDSVDEENLDNSPVTNRTTPSRNCDIAVADTDKEITTPTSHIHVVKLAQAVTTSTPTHPVAGGWSLFPDQGVDSPLSEIENNENSAQSIGIEPFKSDSDVILPKLKSIIVTGSRIGLGSQDSSEKHVSYQESGNNTEASAKIKKVKFADDTVFEQEPKIKRVYRKPKRMLTPGPQKPKSYYNPRFQALINRFEGQVITFARTPVINNKEIPQENTPSALEHNLPARAISFKEDSPNVESKNNTKESNDSYRTCVDSSDQPINNAISALTTNIAGSLQTCLNSVLRTTEEETEIQFKFVITKKKVSVKRIVDDGDGIEEKTSEVEREPEQNKENIWSTVAKAVRNVFWGDKASSNSVTPYKPAASIDSTSSSASKRKFVELSDSELSPLNHKRHKYEGRIRGRPPLQRSKTWGVAGLRSFRSDEQHSSLKNLPSSQDDEMNQSF